MAETPSSPLLHHIRHLIGDVPEAALTDRQLLERFLAHADDTAVEVLVRRYGPLVLGVCRRVLRNAHAAEDAFQATFLVLVRQAPSLGGYDRLGGFLYRVAYRLALRARANEARRRQCEARAAQSRADRESPDASPDDRVVALEEELQRLPQRHRAPLVLCYLEGKTNGEAADLLGCPRGSMSARLAQARERLRNGLTRRGFVTPSAIVAGVLATDCAPAAVPPPLLDNTVRAALWFTGEKGAAVSCVSAQAVALARGAFRAMFVNKLKIAAAALLAAAMLGMGATMLLKAAPQASLPAQAEAASPPEDLARGGMARMGPTQLRHGDTVYFAACMPDGKALVTAGRDRTVRLWDLATGKELRRFDWGRVQPDRPPEPAADDPLQRLEHQVRDDLALSGQAALSPDGKLVAASRGGVVCLWETATGTKLQDLQTGQKRVDQLAFAADGKALLTLGPGQATAVWELATGKCVQRIEPRPPTAFYVNPFATILEQIAIVSPGWKYLAFRQQAENDGPWSIHIQERATGKEVRRICTGDGRAPLAFSPDEKVLVWAPFEGGDIVFSDVATGKELRRLGGGSTPYDLATNFAFAADGQSLAVSRASHTVEIWHLTPGQPAGRLTLLSQARLGKKDAPVRPALAFSPDGKKLVCSLGGPTLSQFDADTGKEVPGPADGHRAPVSTLALSADGKSLYTCGRGDPVRIWDWATGKETGSRWLPSSATHAAFAADGRWAFADGKVVTLCGADGKKIREIAFGEMPLAALALSPDGELLAARSHKFPDAAHLWDAKGKHRHTLVPSGDGSNSSIEVVTETTGVVVPDLIFSPDGRFLAGAGSGPLCLWAVDTGHLLWQRSIPAGKAVERFAFSPNGHRLAASHADGSVTLYEAQTGQTCGRLGSADATHRRVHLTLSFNGGSGLLGTRPDESVSLAFSPDGRYLALAQRTPEVHLWDVLAGREVSRLEGHEGRVVSLLFARDGKHLFSGSTDTTARAWDLTRLTQPQPARAARLQPETLDALWANLAGKDAVRAFEALRKLSASPDQAIALIKEHLHPATPPDRYRVAQLLAGLASGRFDVRRQAEGDLEGLGRLAEPALRRALANDPTLDQRLRLERLLAKLATPAVEEMLAFRAVELLELLGSAEARQVLRTLAEGEPTARLTSESARAVRRLTHRDVKP